MRGFWEQAVRKEDHTHTYHTSHLVLLGLGELIGFIQRGHDQAEQIYSKQGAGGGESLGESMAAGCPSVSGSIAIGWAFLRQREVHPPVDKNAALSTTAERALNTLAVKKPAADSM